MTAQAFESVRVTAEEKVKRDRWNRPIIKQLDGGEVAYTRMTTLAKILDDETNLTRWKCRNVLLGCVERPDLLLAARAHREDKDQLNKLADDAMEAAKAHAKATIGTAIHKLTEDVDNGRPLDGVPAEWVADLAAYAAATAELHVEAIETFRVLDDLKVAGTADRIVSYQGRRYIADLKTGRIDYPMAIAMQLAGYSRGKPYDVATGQRLDEPPVDQDRGIVISLPAGTGTCELVWVNLQAGWEGLQLAAQIHAYRKRKDFSSPLVSVDQLAEAIKAAPTLEALGAVWQQNRERWTADHDALATQRAEQLKAAS